MNLFIGLTPLISVLRETQQRNKIIMSAHRLMLMQKNYTKKDPKAQIYY